MVVSDNRVDGILAVSRSLGDFAFKQKPILGAAGQAVSAVPEFETYERSNLDQFIVIACDGIWDCKSNEECVEYLTSEIEDQKGGLKEWHNLTDPIEKMLESICAEQPRASKGTTDNCSCIVLYFHQNMGYNKSGTKPRTP